MIKRFKMKVARLLVRIVVKLLGDPERSIFFLGSYKVAVKRMD